MLVGVKEFTQAIDRFGGKVAADSMILIPARLLPIEQVNFNPYDEDGDCPVWLELRKYEKHMYTVKLMASVLYKISESEYRYYDAVRHTWRDLHARHYNMLWRIWSDRPTEKQQFEEEWLYE